MPNQNESSLISAAGSIVSNAAERSNKVSAVTLFFSMLVAMSLVILSKIVSDKDKYQRLLWTDGWTGGWLVGGWIEC